MQKQWNFILKYRFKKKVFDVIYQFFLRKHSANAVRSGFFNLRYVYVAIGRYLIHDMFM